jgi:hypothetical protein
VSEYEASEAVVLRILLAGVERRHFSIIAGPEVLPLVFGKLGSSSELLVLVLGVHRLAIRGPQDLKSEK